MVASYIMLKSEQFLPVELNGVLEDMIVKAARQLLRVFHKLGSRVSDVISLTILSAVCRSWWTIVASRHLKTHLHQQFDCEYK